MSQKGQWSLFEWEYLDERGTVKPTSVWDFKDVNSERGTEVFIKFLGFEKNAFPNPKPVGTIERILKIASDKDSIILDSFAGSGTTAHAVLNMNKADGGSRRFILVEMNDYAETITAERVRRVIDGYGDTEGTGGGFSFYDLGEPLMDGDVLNESVGIEAIREYVWFMETRTPYAQAEGDNEYYLGSSNGTAYYFYYQRDAITELDYNFLSTLSPEHTPCVIYADTCLLAEETLEKLGVVFKKIPRDIARL